MLQRHQHAEIAAGRIDGADEGDGRDQHELLDIGKGKPGRRGQRGAEQHQRADVVAWRDKTDHERQHRGAEQRGGRHQADARGVVAERGHVGRQDDDGETVAEAAQGPGEIECDDVDVRCPSTRNPSMPNVAQHLDGGPSQKTRELRCPRERL